MESKAHSAFITIFAHRGVISDRTSDSTYEEPSSKFSSVLNWRVTMTSSAPVTKQRKHRPRQRLNTFLDKHMLPYPVKFLTNRVVILATLALLIPLLFFTSDQSFVNALNSYLNVMSVVVSSTVLLYATIADARDRAAAQRADEIARAYEQVLENGVQERDRLGKAYEQVLEERVLEREEIVSAYHRVLEERVLEREEVSKAYEHALEQRLQEREDLAKAYEQVLEKRVLEREEIAKAYEQVLEKRVQADHELIEKILENRIQNVLVERLEKIRIENHKHIEEMFKSVIASSEAQRAESAELVKLVHAMHEHNLSNATPANE